MCSKNITYYNVRNIEKQFLGLYINHHQQCFAYFKKSFGDIFTTFAPETKRKIINFYSVPVN